MSVPRIIAIETTKRCNLHCIHCRASAGVSDNTDSGGAGQSLQDELTKDEIFRLFDALAEAVPLARE